eukprot:1162028-Pelagomonas_calceolata.AAC.3
MRGVPVEGSDGPKLLCMEQTQIEELIIASTRLPWGLVLASACYSSLFLCLGLPGCLKKEYNSVLGKLDVSSVRCSAKTHDSVNVNHPVAMYHGAACGSPLRSVGYPINANRHSP